MFDHFKLQVGRWGLLRSVYAIVMEKLERFVGLNVFVIQSRPLDTNPPRDSLPPGDEVRVISANELLEFALDQRLDMSQDFVTSATKRGDVCVGYLESGKLLAYSWLGRGQTPMEAGLSIRFGEGYSYGYKAFTLPAQRGRRLQQCIVHESDRWLTSQGSKYNIDYIRTHNFPSIIADRRYGNVPVGYAGYLKWFGSVRTFRTSGTKRHQFEFVQPTS